MCMSAYVICGSQSKRRYWLRWRLHFRSTPAIDGSAIAALKKSRRGNLARNLDIIVLLSGRFYRRFYRVREGFCRTGENCRSGSACALRHVAVNRARDVQSWGEVFVVV